MSDNILDSVCLFPKRNKPLMRDQLPFNDLIRENEVILNVPRPRILDHSCYNFEPTGFFDCRNIKNDEAMQDNEHLYLHHDRLGYLKIKATLEEVLSFGIADHVRLRIRRQHIDGKLIACIAEITYTEN